MPAALGCLRLFRPLEQSATGGVAYKQRTSVCIPPCLELTLWDHGVREVRGEPSSSYRLLLMAFHSRWGLTALWGLLSKGVNPIHEGSAFMTQSPPNTVTLGVRIPTCEFWGDTNIPTITRGATLQPETGKGLPWRGLSDGGLQEKMLRSIVVVGSDRGGNSLDLLSS